MTRVIDANAHVGPTVYDDFEFEPTIGSLEKAMDKAGIDEAVVSPLKPPSFDFDAANARLAACLSTTDKFYPIGRVDPRVANATSHAETALTEYGMNGLKLHPWEETFSITDPSVSGILEVASNHGSPVWIHAGYPGVSHALSIRELAQSFPDTPLILTHGAQLDISGLSLPDAMKLAEGTENTYFELSGVYRRDLVVDLVDSIGSDRLVFGTNAPYFHPRVEKSRVTHADIDGDHLPHILSKSIHKLLV